MLAHKLRQSKRIGRRAATPMESSRRNSSRRWKWTNVARWKELDRRVLQDESVW